MRVPDNARANASIEAMERQMWNAVPTTGVLQLSFDPLTGARRSIFMNQARLPNRRRPRARFAATARGGGRRLRVTAVTRPRLALLPFLDGIVRAAGATGGGGAPCGAPWR